MIKIVKDFLDKNRFSRPGYKLDAVKYFVWHWNAKPGASDTSIKRFFNSIAQGIKKTDGAFWYASTQFAVDEDSITQMMELDEVAYQVGSKKYTKFVYENIDKKYYNMRNLETKLIKTPNWICLGVEICHIDKAGRMHHNTLSNLIELSMFVCEKFNLNPLTDIIRHYDITGKDCPKWFVDHPHDFEFIKKDIDRRLKLKKKWEDKLDRSERFN